jgi:Flp pilus assembly protein TadB
MNRARAPRGDNDSSGKRGKPNTAQVAIILGIAAGMVIALVGTFVWAQAWTALGVVFVAAALIFIIPAVIVILKSNGGSTPH